MSRRIKINFKSIIGDNYSVIPKSEIAKTSLRIKKDMTKFLMELKKKGILL